MSPEQQRYDMAEFFRREHQKLVHYVRRLIDDAADRDSEDIVQDVALHIFDQADVTVPIRHLAGYVYQALRNRVVDLLRKGAHETIAIDAALSDDSQYSLADVLRDARPDPAEEVEQQELRQRLFAAIDRLSPEYKAVIIETEFEGRTFAELSVAWEIPIGTLLARKSRGLKRIRAALADLERS